MRNIKSLFHNVLFYGEVAFKSGMMALCSLLLLIFYPVAAGLHTLCRNILTTTQWPVNVSRRR